MGKWAGSARAGVGAGAAASAPQRLKTGIFMPNTPFAQALLALAAINR